MTQDQLEEIKQRIDLIELIGQYVPLKKTGRNFKAICPFHPETAPSFIVSPERQIWKCFGCGKGGDHFGFLMAIENLEFSEALKALAKRAGVKLKSFRPSEDERIKGLFYEINHLTSEYFHYLLLSHPTGKGALNYILNRGITKQSLSLFKLGFAPSSWDSLQKFLVGKKRYRVEDLEKAGLIIKKTAGYYDRFRDRLMFPLKDHQGNVVGFAGRVLDPQVKDLPAGRQEPKYINTPETLIYHKSDLLYGLTETKNVIKKADQAILVEGELDLISSYQAEVANVVAIKGSALTENQVRLLARFSKNIVFSLDKDIAGDNAARRGIEVADAFGMAIKVIRLEGGKDPDEVAQKNPQLWRKLVERATPVYDYFLDSAFDRYDVKSADGKRKIGQELVPILAKINDEITKSHYVKQLAEKLAVEEGAIYEEIAKIKSQQGGKIEKAVFLNEEKLKLPWREAIEEYLLTLAFQSENWLFLSKGQVRRLVKTPRFKRILEELNQYLEKFKTIKSERLAKQLPPELLEVFNQFYLFDFADLLKDEEKLDKELKITLERLKELDLREQLQAIAGQIRAIENKRKLTTDEKSQLKEMDRKFRDLSQKLTAF